ncbi:thioredoxin (macronuclear) [Tetrahymena thermophila SB210]|uniref:protein disulfide-isomerase n=1 Tax=Tetrahymena thermophila (strain SB210) TaxID=312017 RepID=I7LTE0_TETTS|nr:thioredoxin [Tetrahymena thermophila SB210]EAR85072.2 thioredoxin [Tetrahymena thermophila SB210]|eukprot:XP_001032735.2 thioredoxin [Tetrahymena thermophila SB210]
MKKIHIFVVALLLLLVVIQAKKEQQQSTKNKESLQSLINKNQTSNVVTIEVTSDNYEQLKTQSKYLLILFATAERSFQKFLIDYHQLHEKLNSNGTNDFKLGYVNHENWPDFAKINGAKKVPGLILISQQGKQKDIYKGMNYINDVYSWVIKSIKAPKTSSLFIENFEQLKAKMDQFQEFALFLGSTPDTPEFKTFESLASKKKDLVLAHTFDKVCREENGYKEADVQALILYSQKEKELGMFYINYFKGNLQDVNQIKSFLKIYTTPSIQMVRPWETSKIYENAKENLVLAINQQNYYESNEQPQDLMTKEELAFLDLRPKLMNQVFLNLLNITERNREEVAKSFMLDTNYTLPQVFFIQQIEGRQSKKYVFSGDKINVQTMMQFIQDIKKGKVQPLTQKEKPIPKEKLDSLLVKPVVAENWDEYVYKNNQQDVLVFFYSIGCYHCDQFKPTFYHLAHRLKHNPHLLLVRVNIGDNDIPDVHIKRTPEFKLYKANQKDSPVSFIYSTKQSTLIEALKQEVTFPWVQPLSENEVQLKDIVIDDTELEAKFKVEQKQRELEAEKQRKQEAEKQKLEESQKDNLAQNQQNGSDTLQNESNVTQNEQQTEQKSDL